MLGSLAGGGAASAARNRMAHIGEGIPAGGHDQWDDARDDTRRSRFVADYLAQGEAYLAEQRDTLAEQQRIIEEARDKARIARELAEQLRKTDEALNSLARAEQRAVWRAKSAAKDARRDECRRLKREANELTTATAAARTTSTAIAPSPPNAPSPYVRATGTSHGGGVRRS